MSKDITQAADALMAAFSNHRTATHVLGKTKEGQAPCITCGESDQAMLEYRIARRSAEQDRDAADSLARALRADVQALTARAEAAESARAALEAELFGLVESVTARIQTYPYPDQVKIEDDLSDYTDDGDVRTCLGCHEHMGGDKPYGAPISHRPDCVWLAILALYRQARALLARPAGDVG